MKVLARDPGAHVQQSWSLCPGSLAPQGTGNVLSPLKPDRTLSRSTLDASTRCVAFQATDHDALTPLCWLWVLGS